MTEVGALWLEAFRRLCRTGNTAPRRAMAEHLASICDERGRIACTTTTTLSTDAGLTYRGGADALRELRRHGWLLTVENRSRDGSVRQLEVPPSAMRALDQGRAA